VTVEAVSWVTRFVGGDGTSRILMRESLQPGDTPRTVLRRVSSRHPKLDEILWDAASGSVSEHVQVMVNNVLIGPEEVAQQLLAAGDTITLIGQYMGG
jgi:hypothetical protein